MGSRFDDIGLFWEDVSYSARRNKNEIGPMPPIPETGWRAPTHFPDLSRASCIALDTETFDPELKEAGPGWARGSGHIIGVSLAVDWGRWYFPVAHETNPEQNLDKRAVMDWLRQVLANPHQPKIGANLMYDIGWLEHEGVKVAGSLIDVQYAEALLSSDPTTNLDYLAKKYLNLGKETDLLYEWLQDWFPTTGKSSLRKWLYKTPPQLAGAYAEADAELPLLIARKQYHLLEQQGLLSLFDQECRSIRLLVAMRFAGVRVDIDRAEKLRDTLLEQEEVAQKELNKTAGVIVDVNGRSINEAFDALGLSYPLTKKGKPSFTKPFLESHPHPIAAQIMNVRKLQKTRSTFVESYILDNNVNGMVYGQFHPLKSDSGGARTGRFSSSTPNLQNIPSRDPYWAPLVRGLFMPDEGHDGWRKYDYSQIEYRLLAHFAQGHHAHIVQQQYIEDPNADFHEQTGKNIKKFTGRDLASRGQIKSINFGFVYGMGKKKVIKTLGITKQEGDALYEAYHAANPYVSPTFDHYSDLAQSQGYVETILGRRIRFDLWEPDYYDENAKALPYEAAMREYGGNIKRGMTHKALNAVLQGSSADQMKTAMLRCWDDGIFDYIGVPRLTVHDELDFSDPGGVDDGFDEMQRVMATCLQLKVPVICDCDRGPDWGHVEQV